MNTIEIDKILSRNSKTRSYFMGCFPADGIPTIASGFPKCLVVNTDPSWSPGEHWLAIFLLGPENVEYYDSLGQWPPQSPEIANYLSKFQHIRHNKFQIQADRARSCGRHAIFFLYHRCAGIPFRRIIDVLRRVSDPDRMVNEFIRRRIFDTQDI